MQDSTLGPDEQKRAMRNSTLNGMSYAAMVGMGESYIPAAALSLGATDFYIGLLSAFPQFLGAVFQFFSIHIIRLLGSRKWATVAGDAFQGLVYLPIIALLLWPGPLSVPLLILFFSLGTAATLMINPAWSSWVSDIVPDQSRPAFFASRSRAIQLALFISTFGAGYALRFLELNYSAAIAFSLVFLGAAISRAFSTYFNFLIPDIKYEISLIREIRFVQLFTLPGYRNELWFLVFMALINATTQFAAPFFIPHMIENLHFDLGLVGMLIAIPVIAKVFFFPYWGWAADRFGNRAVLISTSFLTPALPLLWLLSSDPSHLALIQVFAGFAWAGFDLAAFNYALAMVERELRPSFISKYNAFNGLFYAIGAVSGGIFLSQFPALILLGFAGIPLVFLVSGIARFLTFAAFSPRLSSAHEIPNKSSERGMILQIVAVAPTMGAIHQAMHGWNFTRNAVETGAAESGVLLRAGAETGSRVIHFGAATGKKALRAGAETGGRVILATASVSGKALKAGAERGKIAFKASAETGGKVIRAGTEAGGRVIHATASISGRALKAGAATGTKVLKKGFGATGSIIVRGGRTIQAGATRGKSVLREGIGKTRGLLARKKGL